MNANAVSNTDDWNTHWSSYAESNSLNPAQAYRRMLIFRALGLSRATEAQSRLFELGCGQGEFSVELKQRHPNLNLAGIDLSQTGADIAKSRVPSGAFFQQDMLKPITLPEQYRGWATHAVCSEVLEHVDDPTLALRNIRSLFAPGARLVITVPAGPMSAFDEHIGHRRHFTPARLRQVLTDAGLEVESLNGAGFPFFNLYRLTVVARGKKLIQDAGGALPRSARAAMWAFNKLFRLNRIETQLGWQLIAVAKEPNRAEKAR
jgi:2-polyprenyl-3-methyl-5-hydroxy-6-metoxy-1,4-benzoquinol methylase